MPIIIIFALLLPYCFTSAAAQPILEITFKELESGEAYLWNTNKVRMDTIRIINHQLTYTEAPKEPTL